MLEEEINVLLNYPVHMIKMAANAIYGKSPLKFYFGTTRPISRKFGMKHRGLGYYNIFTNYDLWMTLIYFTARSAHGLLMHFNGGNCLNVNLKGKTCMKWGNGLKICVSEHKLDPRGWSAPTLGQYTCILQ